jgi:hypothetical protein
MLMRTPAGQLNFILMLQIEIDRLDLVGSSAMKIKMIVPTACFSKLSFLSVAPLGPRASYLFNAQAAQIIVG